MTPPLEKIKEILTDDIKAVIFDMDGTLYDQRKMHKYMIKALFRYYWKRPHKWYELVILYVFRKNRYLIQNTSDIASLQYDMVAKSLHVSQDRVRQVVAMWIEEKPLQFMKRCMYDVMPLYFKIIHEQGLKIAVVSDYPVTKKLQALGLSADVEVCSTDKDVNALKPSPEGFLYAAKKMNIKKDCCVVIGDRDDKDGEAARLATMRFYHVDRIL